MTKQEVDREALEYFEREFRRQERARLDEMRASDDPWRRGQYDLWYGNDAKAARGEKPS